MGAMTGKGGFGISGSRYQQTWAWPSAPHDDNDGTDVFFSMGWRPDFEYYEYWWTPRSSATSLESTA
jgi:hypothetical protein